MLIPLNLMVVIRLDGSIGQINFFYFHRIPYNQMLMLASIHMEGKTLVWYQDIDMAEALPNWEVFTHALMERFGPTCYDDRMEALTRLK